MEMALGMNVFVCVRCNKEIDTNYDSFWVDHTKRAYFCQSCGDEMSGKPVENYVVIP